MPDDWIGYNGLVDIGNKNTIASNMEKMNLLMAIDIL